MQPRETLTDCLQQRRGPYYGKLLGQNDRASPPQEDSMSPLSHVASLQGSQIEGSLEPINLSWLGEAGNTLQKVGRKTIHQDLI